jgi:hypothetical protein
MLPAYTPNPKITGYHGTALEKADSILSQNFIESINHTKWFGDGVYFFIHGVSIESPIEIAHQFCLDNRSDIPLPERNNVCVIEAVVKVNNNKLLDLTIVPGNQLFNSYRDNIIADFAKAGKKLKSDVTDYHIFQDMRKNLGIEFVKGNVYIRLGIQRKLELPSKVPNVTIFVVNKPLSNINKPSLKVVKGGK